MGTKGGPLPGGGPPGAGGALPQQVLLSPGGGAPGAFGGPGSPRGVWPAGKHSMSEVTINNSKPHIRHQLTKRSFQQELEAKWRVVIMSKGRYYPPGAPLPGSDAPDNERPLFLRVVPSAALPQVCGPGWWAGLSPGAPAACLPADVDVAEGGLLGCGRRRAGAGQEKGCLVCGKWRAGAGQEGWECGQLASAHSLAAG